MNIYSEKELDLARRIYDATMLVSGRMTTRKAKNMAKRLNFPHEVVLSEFYLEAARNLLIKSQKELDDLASEVVDRMG